MNKALEHGVRDADFQRPQITAQARMTITVRVNGHDYRRAVGATERASHFLRERLGLTGTKHACGEGECGACSILLDDLPVNACMVLAFQLDGRKITTIEGLEHADGRLSRLQQAFLDHGAVQCGYCTPGLVIASEGLLRKTADPSMEDIRLALAGNICRCTGLVKAIEAVHAVANERNRASRT